MWKQHVSMNRINKQLNNMQYTHEIKYLLSFETEENSDT